MKLKSVQKAIGMTTKVCIHLEMKTKELDQFKN